MAAESLPNRLTFTVFKIFQLMTEGGASPLTDFHCSENKSKAITCAADVT
jgi:hypothetical protein